MKPVITFAIAALALIGVIRAFGRKKENNATQRQIDQGEAAMRRLIRTGKDQIAAMHHPQLGPIDFLWGNSKFGIRHALEHRAKQLAALGGQNGEKILLKAPTVIMRAVLPEDYATRRRITLTFDGYLVMLSNQPPIDAENLTRSERKRALAPIRPHWIFTAFDVSETRRNFSQLKSKRRNKKSS